MDDNTQVFEDAPEDRKQRRPRPVIIKRQVPIGFAPQGKTSQIIIAK